MPTNRFTRRRCCRTSALTLAVATGNLAANDVERVWALAMGVPVTLHALVDGPAVIAAAGRLERTSAYDAAYLALAELLGAELWTLDGRLATARILGDVDRFASERKLASYCGVSPLRRPASTSRAGSAKARPTAKRSGRSSA